MWESRKKITNCRGDYYYRKGGMKRHGKKNTGVSTVAVWLECYLIMDVEGGRERELRMNVNESSELVELLRR